MRRQNAVKHKKGNVKIQADRKYTYKYTYSIFLWLFEISIYKKRTKKKQRKSIKICIIFNILRCLTLLEMRNRIGNGNWKRLKKKERNK